MTETLPTEYKESAIRILGGNRKQFVTMRVGEQLLGLPVLLVQDVIRPQHVTPVPLSQPEVSGCLNLRGRIVTVVDMRERLGLATKPQKDSMNIVVEFDGDLYSLVVDSIGDVMTLPDTDFGAMPPNLSKNWQDISSGVYRLDQQLLVVIDLNNLLSF